jgi:hypothetical protein
MHLAFISKILRQSQRSTRGDDTLHRWIVCQVEEHCHTGQRATFGERTAEVIRHIVLDTHSSKHNGEFLAFSLRRASHPAEGSLANDLSRQLIMRHASPGEQGEFLSA